MIPIMKKRLLENVIIIVIFSFVTVFFSTQSFLDYFLKGAPIDFRHLLLWNAVRWLPWAILTPWIVRFGRRFELIRPGWAHTLPIHIAACLAFSFIHSLIQYTAQAIIENTIHLFDFILVTVKTIHLNIITYWIILATSYIIDSHRKDRAQKFPD